MPVKNPIQEKYRKKSIGDQYYELLFEKITKCCEKQEQNPTYFIGRNLRIFLDELLIGKEGKFRKLIDDSVVEWDTVRQCTYRNVSFEKIEVVICGAAQISRTPLRQLMVRLIKKEPKLKAVEDHPEIVANLLKEENKDHPDTESTNKTALHAKSADALHQNTDGFRISKDSIDGTYTIEYGHGEKHLAIPKNTGIVNEEEIGRLLDWQKYLTPFIGRKKELEKLRKWLNDDSSRRSILLMHGEGGVGKTRLAFHFSDEVRSQGWESGRTNTENFVGSWYSGDKGILLVIDYLEDQASSVRQLLRAVERFNVCEDGDKNLRILLISRNHSFLKTIARDADRFVSRIHLTRLSEDEESWEIFKKAWKGLQEFKSYHPNALQASNNLPLPVKNKFLNWQKSDPIHKTPLVIIALAIFLFSEDNDNSSDIKLELKGSDIIRRLSEREERLIRNEVEEYNRLNFNTGNLEVESVLLIKAVATIAGGMDNNKLVSLVRTLNSESTIFKLPEINHLTKLSLWIDNKIPALQPDILATDFLVYCLERWANGRESDWMLAAAGEPPLETSI